MNNFYNVYHLQNAAYVKINKVATQTLEPIFNKLLGPREVGGTVPDYYFKFAFVRNPYDRLVSCWLNQMKKPTRFSKSLWKGGMHKSFWRFPEFSPGMSFNDFVAAVFKIPDDIANPHFRSQYKFFESDIGVMNIYRFENLNQDYLKVCEQIGVESVDLPHKNKSSKRKPYRAYYMCPEIKQMAYKRYQKDFELFGYEVDL